MVIASSKGISNNPRLIMQRLLGCDKVKIMSIKYFSVKIHKIYKFKDNQLEPLTSFINSGYMITRSMASIERLRHATYVPVSTTATSESLSNQRTMKKLRSLGEEFL